MNSLMERSFKFLTLFKAQNIFISLKAAERPVHIFWALKETFENCIPPEQKVAMYYQHNMSEKCLDLLRIKNFLSAEVIYGHMITPENKYCAEIQCGMTSFYYAMAAYRDFALNNFCEAQLKIERSISLAEQQSKLFPPFLLAVVEQWLNKIRILVKYGEEQVLIDEYIALMTFIISGDHIDHEIQIAFRKLNPEKLLSLINHVFTNLHIALNKRYDCRNDKLVELYEKLSSGITITRTPITPQLKDIFIQLQQCISGSTDIFFNTLISCFYCLPHAPFIIKKIVTERFIMDCRAAQIPLTLSPDYEVFEQRIKEHLKIDIQSFYELYTS